nr:DUF2799 domain-containing protein [Zoogloeaceae bacterium]
MSLYAAVRRSGMAGLGALTLLSAGCATIPEEQCASVDWRRLGVEDGRAGFSAARIVRHREACAGVGVVPDAAAWEAGRSLGLADYCVLGNAIENGLARNAYEGVCADARFGRAYDAARRLGEARFDIERVDDELTWRERELATDRKLSDKRRAELRAEIRNLERQRDRARDDRRDAEINLDRVRLELGI